MFKYKDFVSRNWAFISEESQRKIKKTKLLIAGCGLGSYIAELAVRLGFEEITILDDDKVELTNLNRQNYYLGDIGKKKVDCLKNSLKRINPKVKINFYDKRVERVQEINALLSKSEVVVNSFDISKIYFDLIENVAKEKKFVFLPFNVGFGSCLISLNYSNYEYFLNNYSDSKTDLELLLAIINNPDNKNNIKIPGYIKKGLKLLKSDIEKKKFNPQIGVASFVTAALTITEIIKFFEGKKK